MKDQGKKAKEELIWTPATLLATVFPFGMMPKAPGTWGSLPGLAFAVGLDRLSRFFLQDLYLIGIALGLLALGALSWWSIDRTEAMWDTHDDGRIVIDEVLGQAMAVVFFPFDLLHLGLGFLLFRLFDIWKPGPIGWADRRLPGAWGTLLDDVIAGIFAALALLLLSQALRTAL